jgi:hypothetical protein
MKTKIKLLRDHNAWRRGNDNFVMTNPAYLGIAIDAVCNHAERYEYLLTLDIEDITDLKRRAKVSGVCFSILLDEIMDEQINDKKS